MKRGEFSAQIDGLIERIGELSKKVDNLPNSETPIIRDTIDTRVASAVLSFEFWLDELERAIDNPTDLALLRHRVKHTFQIISHIALVDFLAVAHDLDEKS